MASSGYHRPKEREDGRGRGKTDTRSPNPRDQMKLRVTYDHVKTTPTAYGATIGERGVVLCECVLV
jgi:hypothetical protein